MISEIQLSIPALDFSGILDLSGGDLLLSLIPPSYVPHLNQDENLRQAQRSQGEGMAKHVRGLSVYLARYDSSGIAHRLLKPNGGGSPVVRGDVDPEPGDVQPDTDILFD